MVLSMSAFENSTVVHILSLIRASDTEDYKMWTTGNFSDIQRLFRNSRYYLSYNTFPFIS